MKNNSLNKALFFSKANDFLNIYLKKQAMKSDNTVHTYQDGLTVFRKYLSDVKKISIGKFKFEECTHDFLLEYMAYLKDKGCTAGTCNNRLAAIRVYLWYVADGDISMQSIALAASKVPFIKGTQKVKETINANDLAALLAAPSDKTKIGIRDKTILILLYDSAISVSELRELTIESLKLNETIPYIRVHGKGDKERIVSITDKTVEHLKRYIRRFHSEMDSKRPLFYTVIKGNLSAMSTGNVERILNKYAEMIRPEHPNLDIKRIHKFCCVFLHICIHDSKRLIVFCFTVFSENAKAHALSSILKLTVLKITCAHTLVILILHFRLKNSFKISFSIVCS